MRRRNDLNSMKKKRKEKKKIGGGREGVGRT
jgi:hypothetical protein